MYILYIQVGLVSYFCTPSRAYLTKNATVGSKVKSSLLPIFHQALLLFFILKLFIHLVNYIVGQKSLSSTLVELFIKLDSSVYMWSHAQYSIQWTCEAMQHYYINM